MFLDVKHFYFLKFVFYLHFNLKYNNTENLTFYKKYILFKMLLNKKTFIIKANIFSNIVLFI